MPLANVRKVRIGRQREKMKLCIITLLQEADVHRVGLFLLIVHG